MRTLRNYALIYDDQCPICQVYTKALVVTGVFEKKGREAYQVMDNQTCTLIDKDRARNEIALVNKKTGEVNYGLDSLLKVTYYIFPFAKYIFKHYLGKMKRSSPKITMANLFLLISDRSLHYY